MKVVSSRRICVHFCQVLRGVTSPRPPSIKFTAWYFFDNPGNANSGYNSMWGQAHGHNSQWQVFLLLLPLLLLTLEKSTFGSYFPSEYNPLGSKFNMGESLSLVSPPPAPGLWPFRLLWLLTPSCPLTLCLDYLDFLPPDPSLVPHAWPLFENPSSSVTRGAASLIESLR